MLVLQINIGKLLDFVFGVEVHFWWKCCTEGLILHIRKHDFRNLSVTRPF